MRLCVSRLSGDWPIQMPTALAKSFPPSWIWQSVISFARVASFGCSTVVAPILIPPAPKSENSQPMIWLLAEAFPISSPYVPRCENEQFSKEQLRIPSPQTAPGTPTAACAKPPGSIGGGGFLLGLPVPPRKPDGKYHSLWEKVMPRKVTFSTEDLLSPALFSIGGEGEESVAGFARLSKRITWDRTGAIASICSGFSPARGR